MNLNKIICKKKKISGSRNSVALSGKENFLSACGSNKFSSIVSTTTSAATTKFMNDNKRCDDDKMLIVSPTEFRSFH